jgi:L-iditol 2-dehydrogenase/galactitol-1-phosphate 5-dehydrogenase
MKALLLEGKDRLVYTDVPEPEPVGERTVLVRVAAVGVCGSDLPRFLGKAYHYPLILGHEFSAVVEQSFPGGRYKKGDRVAVYPLLPNPRDPLVRIGEPAVSTGYDYFGSRRHGAMAERLIVPEDNLVAVPDDVPLVHAAVVEPAAVSLHAMLKPDLPPNASALVIGGGPIGAFAAMWLRILGASRVIVAEVDERKRDILGKLGFEVIDAQKQNTVSAVKEMTGGRGVDVAVEACGLGATLLQCLEAAATFGQVVFLGDHHADVTFSGPLISSMLRRELRVYGTWNSKMLPPGNSEWDMVLAHMGKGFQVEPFISHTPSLSKGPQVFADIAARKIWYNKVVFVVSDEAKNEKRSQK